MGIDRTTLARRQARFVAACKHCGVKATHQRIQVFRELARSDDHPDAETIYRRVRRRVPTISLDTVYRTLRLLESRGIIARIGSLGGPARFDANEEPHHHFVCTECGLMYDFCQPNYDHVSLPPAVAEIGTVKSVCVEVRGLCRKCEKNRVPQRAPG
jgi:Fur family peroxide stress response transcriptional regulator